MSTYTERLEEVSSPEAVKWARKLWVIPALLLVMAGMFWTRARSWENFVRDGTVYFSGNDAWWHFRETMWTVNHWPRTIPFDPWTGYPKGISNGQFGTLYDQIVATVAIVIGGGDPTVETVRMTLLFVPPIAAALTAIPVYLITKQVTGRRLWGVLSAVVLALYPGYYFSRGLVGAADHNIVEPLFMCMAVASLIWSMQKTGKKIPVLDIDPKDLVRDLSPGLVSGVFITIYMLVWPPGILLMGIFGAFAVTWVIIELLRDSTVEHILLHTGAVGLGIALSLLPFINFGGRFSPTVLGPLHLAMAVGIFAGPLFVIGVNRKTDPRTTVGSIVGIGIVGTLVLMFALPDLWATLTNNVMKIIGLGTNANTRTIAEAQPMGARGGLGNAIYAQYGTTFVLGIVGIIVCLKSFYRDNRPDSLFVMIWWLFLFMAAVTQVRFNYYLTPALAVLVGIGVRELLILINMDQLESWTSPVGWQVIATVIVIGLLLPGLVIPANATVVDRGERAGPGASVVWDESNTWLQENSPDPEMGSLYGDTYSSDYEYPESSYGVMSWWDYGHWITVQSERVPFANPFQQNSRGAAKWLLATNESNAQDAVDSLDSRSNNIRYAMVDWQMISPRGKFGAPVVFNENVSRQDVLTNLYSVQDGQYRYAATLTDQRYYESMMVRLYLFHGSRAETQPVVVNSRQEQVETRSGEMTTISVVQEGTQPVRTFQNMTAAREYARDTGGRIGGVGLIPQEDVPALEHHRLVHVNSQSAVRSGYRSYLSSIARLGVPPEVLTNQPQWVKTFERVPGAQITGTAPANTTVTATVQMESRAGPFQYKQEAQTGADGEWTMTVPYSTTGYNSSPEYTNVSVRANGPYNVTYQNTTLTVQVSEQDVMENETIVVGE